MRHHLGSMTVRGWLLWAVLTALMTLENLALGHGSTVWVWIAGTAVAFGVVVRLRREEPLVALGFAMAVTSAVILKSVIVGGGFTVVHVGVLVLASYLAGRHASSTRGFVWLVLIADALLGALGIPLRGSALLVDAILSWFFVLIGSLVVVVFPWLLGRYREQQARLASAGWERAERLEAEQRMALEQARLRERNRIAQDMHDSLGHELSLIALRAGALEVDGSLANEHRRAAAELRASAADATERLGEVVGVLRAGDAPTRPSAESVVDIVARAAASGMDVRLREIGPARPLSMVARQTTARVVQEALTNAAKHGPGASVLVTVAHSTREVVLRVSNDAPTEPKAQVRSGGNGLAGLAERVRLVGGTLTSGPVADGFAVEARVPYEAEITAALRNSDRDGTEGSESAAEQQSVRERARRGLVTAIAAPVAIGAAIGLTMLVYYVVIGYFSTMDRADYEDLQVGRHRTDVQGHLPAMQMVDAPTRSGPSRPDGATCEYYRSGHSFTTTFAYRLCFDDDVLVSKDRVQTGSTPMEEGDR